MATKVMTLCGTCAEGEQVNGEEKHCTICEECLDLCDGDHEDEEVEEYDYYAESLWRE